MANLDFKNSHVLVEELLGDKPYEKTEKVSLNMPDGSRQGPYVRKTFTSDSGLIDVYKKLQGVEHPGLPRIYYVDDTTVFEKFVEGERLDKAKNVEAQKYFPQLCDTVNFLHTHFDKPLIHRDIKPANIIIEPNGQLKLIDFGIARTYDSNNKTDTQHFGTVGYAPPEQFGYQQTDVRSDIYALGKVLDFMSDDYEDIVARACSFDPNDRYKNVEALKAAFERDKFLSNPVLHKIGIVWDAILIVFTALMIGITVGSLLTPGNVNHDNNTPIVRLIFGIMTVGFIYLPVCYIFLYKKPFKFLPKLNWKQQIFMVIICTFMVFALAILANMLK